MNNFYLNKVNYLKINLYDKIKIIFISYKNKTIY